MNRSTKFGKRALAIVMAAMTMFTVACGSSASDGSEEAVKQSGEGTRKEAPEGSSIDTSLSFAEAHDAFQTTLTRQENDDYDIPAPPEGLFDLVSYSSKVGDLAAYVSSDPGDGEKHPMIIWVVGGWGNGIDDFPFCYPEWDDDQTGSAFWQEGILTMYPSFRGGNGNPGYYEALFGEVDDIISAYEYAASLPYVDPERIYLGGHSTGGTRALLASEYTDKFRAVFCFGAVDEIKYHNNDQFTFDTDSKDEHMMRSPIYWLDDVKSPTFLIEGEDGNSDNLRRMEQATQNDNLHFNVVDGADHFSVLAPATRLVAQKILEDTGAEVSISITQEELEAAMAQEPAVPVPVMKEQYLEELGMYFSTPFTWEITEDEERIGWDVYSIYDNDNPWDAPVLFIDAYVLDGTDDLQAVKANMEAEGYETKDITIDGKNAIDVAGVFEGDSGSVYYQRYISVKTDEFYADLSFTTYEDYREECDAYFQTMIDSIRFDG